MAPTRWRARTLLAQARRAVDASLAVLPPLLQPGSTPAAAELAARRRRVDDRSLPPRAVFAAYTASVAQAQQSAAARLRSGMVEVGLPYEHVNHLMRASELLAQVRGLTQGVLRSGQLDATSEDGLRQALLLQRDVLQQYHLAAPPAVRAAQAAALAAPAFPEVATRVTALLQTRDPAVVETAAGAWWPLATTAVDALGRAAQADMHTLAAQADVKIAAIEWQLRLTVAVLVVLGIVTLVLALATVGRIVRGLGLLLGGLDDVATGRNFEARIEDSRRDEFGVISGQVNKLIGIASSVLREQATLALTDPLTGVMNRRGFDQQLAARTRADRSVHLPLSVLMVDADHFKRINDTLGHPAGDEVLKGLAQVMRARLRADDVLARFGGEEFIAILPGCRSAEALRVADLLRQAIAVHDFGVGRPVTVSIGVAEWVDGLAGDALIAQADAALYAAKAGGRNRVCGEVATALAA